MVQGARDQSIHGDNTKRGWVGTRATDDGEMIVNAAFDTGDGHNDEYICDAMNHMLRGELALVVCHVGPGYPTRTGLRCTSPHRHSRQSTGRPTNCALGGRQQLMRYEPCLQVGARSEAFACHAPVAPSSPPSPPIDDLMVLFTRTMIHIVEQLPGNRP